jgi:hypothetical protein
MTAILTRDDIRRIAPSVFASHPIDSVSDRYAFVPTSEVVEIMKEYAFLPVKATQSTCRDFDRRSYTKHCIRFRSADDLTPALQEEVPEIVLVNSHDKTAAYSLSAGLFRLVCSNGLTVASATLGSFSIRHSGSRDTIKQIIDATSELASRMPDLMNTVRDWKQIILPRPRQLEFAEQAHALKANPAIKPAFLLTARRDADYTDAEGNRDLWRTLNVLQENLMQGGISGINTRGRRVSTRPIRSVTADLSINRQLWKFAENYANN